MAANKSLNSVIIYLTDIETKIEESSTIWRTLAKSHTYAQNYVEF